MLEFAAICMLTNIYVLKKYGAKFSMANKYIKLTFLLTTYSYVYLLTHKHTQNTQND